MGKKKSKAKNKNKGIMLKTINGMLVYRSSLVGIAHLMVLEQQKKENKMEKKMEMEREDLIKIVEELAVEVKWNMKDILLNKRLLKAQPNNPNVWKERRLLIGETMKKILDHFRGYEDVPSVWSSLITSHEKSKSGIAKSELEFTKRILSKGTRNCQAWSYREWIIQQFDRRLWNSELQYCHEILMDDSFNVSAWDQICRAVRRLYDDMGKEWRLEEVIFAKKEISRHPGNEGPWIYLRVLYAQDKESLYTNPDLECIYVDILAEEADRLDKVEYFSVNHRGCVHALNLIMDLMFVGYKMNQNRRLVNAVSVLFAHYRTTYEKADLIRQIGEGIFWMVCAVTFSLNASTMRYCHNYRGTSSFKDIHLFRSIEKPPFDIKAMDNTLRAIENDDTTLKKDIKWQCNFEDYATNDAALKKLDNLTDIINNKLASDRDVWSTRQWQFQTFGAQWDDEKEIEFCRKVLEKDTYNIYAWDQRISVATRFVRKINAVKAEGMDIGDDVYTKVEEMENIFLKRRNSEVDDVVKIIRAEPENPFPWCHIMGMYRVYFGSFTSNHKVRDAILGILEQAKNALPGDGGDGIMGDELGVVNVRGLINALNMLLDYIVSHGYDEIENEGSKDLRDVIDFLHPDSLGPSHRRYYPMEKVCYILKRLDNTLPIYGLHWDNAADQMLTGLPFQSY